MIIALIDDNGGDGAELLALQGGEGILPLLGPREGGQVQILKILKKAPGGLRRPQTGFFLKSPPQGPPTPERPFPGVFASKPRFPL